MRVRDCAVRVKQGSSAKQTESALTSYECWLEFEVRRKGWVPCSCWLVPPVSIHPLNGSHGCVCCTLVLLLSLPLHLLAQGSCTILNPKIDLP